MPEREEISAEILLLHERFSASTKEVTSGLTKLGAQFEAAFAKINKSSDEQLNQVIGHLAKLDAKFAESIKGIERQANSVKLEKLASSLSELGGRAQQLFTGAVGKGAGFETEINKIAAISDISGKRLEGFSENLRTMAKDFGLAVGPAETAAVALQAVGSGFEDSASSTKVASNALKLIADGETGAREATKLLTDSLNAYHVSADSAAKFTDIFFQVQNRGVTTIAEMSGSLGLVTSTASSAGVSIEELGAVIVATTKQGIPFSSVVEGTRGLISKLQNPTDEAEKALAKYNLTVNYATLRQKGLAKTLQEIKTAVGDDAAALHDIVGTQQAFAIATALTSDGLKGFNQELEAVKNSAGAADRSVRIIGQGFQNTQKQFDAAVERLRVGATKTILPVATLLVKAAGETFDALDKLPQGVKTFGVVATGAAAAIGLLAGACLFLTTQLVNLNAGLLAAGVNVPAYAAKLALAARMTAATGAATAILEANVVRFAFANGGILSGLSALASTSILASAGVAGLGAGIIALALAYKGATDDLGKYTDQLAIANQGIKEFEDANGNVRQIKFLGREDALNSSAEDLVKRGFNADDLAQALQNARKRAEDSDNAAIKAEFVEQVKALEKKRAEVAQLLGKQAGQNPEAGGAESKSAGQQKEELKEAIHRAELDSKSDQERIDRLKQIKDQYHTIGDDRRSIEDKIDVIEKRIAREAESGRKKAEVDRKRDASEKFKEAVQEVENSKKSVAQKISDLKKLLPQYEKNGDFRRSIEDKILAYEKKLESERDKLAQRRRDRQKADADEQIAEAEHTQRQLEKLQDKGVDTSAQQGAEVDKKAKAEKSKIQAELEKDLAKETDPADREDLKNAAKRAKKQVDREAGDEKEDISERGQQNRAQKAADFASKEVELNQRRLDLLAQYTAEGKGSFGFFEQAALRQLELKEQEIELQKQLALLQTKDPQVIAQIEKAAEAQKLAAKQATRAEIEATTKAMEEQKRKAQEGKSKEFGGNILSLEQFVQGENNRFNDGSAQELYRKMLGGGKKAYVPGLDQMTFDALHDEASRDPAKKSKLGEMDAAARAAKEVQEIRIAGEFVLKGEDGHEVGHLSKLSFNGENSSLSDFARGSSGGL